MGTTPTGNPKPAESAERMNKVVEDVIRRRAGGEEVDDAVVLASHAGLLPDLAERLESLRLVEQAEYMVKSDPGSKEDQDDGDSSSRAGVQGRLPTASIPGYTILTEIHRGGQGVVYKAMQHSTDRIVAIKVMHGGPFGGSRGWARFDREVRILAQLKHPDIVTIHDSGTAAGHHYFVMDYIAGRSLDAFLAGDHLTVDARLALFIKICRAVDAAHSRGVIHRDLKPSNIRVNDSGEPRILDFGLAKTDFEDEGTTVHDLTVSGQFVGSLPWASPEQAAGPPGQISTRSDIYSLGVILYQMVAGRLPYDVSGPLPSALRNIQETVPTRPSALRPEVDEDVDIVVLTCLAKDPQRRYQSVGNLVDDLERYLSNQPILARQPSAIYQLRKLAARHKVPFVLVSTLVLVITGFAITMGILYGQTTRALDRAQQAERQSEVQRASAEREARNARAINDFLIHDMLAAADPGESLGHELTVADALANAAERVGSALKEQPLVEASVRTAVAQSYMSLGLFAAAEEQLHVADDIRSRELSAKDPATLAVRVMLVEALIRQNKLESAGPLCQATYEVCIRELSQSHETTMEAALQQAWFYWNAGERGRSRALFRQALRDARRTLGDRHRLTVKMMSSWTSWGYHEIDFTEATALFEEALDVAKTTLGPIHPQTLSAMANVGVSLAEQRRLAESESLLRKVLALRRKVLGEHPDTVRSMIELTAPLSEAARLDEAEAILREAVGMATRVMGTDHSLTQEATAALANTLLRQGRFAEAVPLFEQALQVCRRVYGGQDVRTANMLDEMGTCCLKLGWYESAERHLRPAFEIMLKTRAQHDRVKAGCLRRYVQSLAGQGRLGEARPLAQQLLEHRRVIAGQTPTNAYWLNSYAWELLNVQPEDLRDPELALEVAREAYGMIGDEYHYNRYTLALAYRANGQIGPAIETVRRAIEHAPLQVSEDRTNYEALLAQLLEKCGDPVAAEQVYRDTMEQRRRMFPAGHSDIQDSVERLAERLLKHGKYSEAEAHVAECFDESPVLQEDCRRLPGPCGLLGASLAAQQEFAKAEPLLLTAFEEIRSREYARLDDRKVALERIVNLYESWDAAESGTHYADRAIEYRELVDVVSHEGREEEKLVPIE